MAIHLKHSCRVFTIRRTRDAASSTVTSAISRRPSSKTIRRAACGVTSSVFATMLADTSGRAMTRSTSSGNVDDVRRPSASLHHRFCRRQPVVLLQRDLAGCNQPMGNASSRKLRSRCRRRSTGIVSRPRFTVARCALAVTPAWRRMEAASTRPSQGACCRTLKTFQASSATIACSTGGRSCACRSTPRHSSSRASSSSRDRRRADLVPECRRDRVASPVQWAASGQASTASMATNSAPNTLTSPLLSSLPSVDRSTSGSVVTSTVPSAAEDAAGEPETKSRPRRLRRPAADRPSGMVSS